MKKNYKVFLLISATILNFSLTSHASPINEARTDLKKQHSINSVICPFEKEVLRYKAGIKQLTKKSSAEKGKNIGKTSDSSNENDNSHHFFEALKYFRVAAKNFETQFLSKGIIDHHKFQEIYAGSQGHTLFYYGHILKYIEHLSHEEEEKIICLNKLCNLIEELSHEEMHLKAPSFEEGQNKGRNMFSSLGYVNQDEAQKFSVSIDQMFLKDPNLILFTIDLQRKWLTKSGGDFEDFFRDLLEEWEPKFSNSTINKLNTIILMPS